jgi:hypothetical protein
MTWDGAERVAREHVQRGCNAKNPSMKPVSRLDDQRQTHAYDAEEDRGQGHGAFLDSRFRCAVCESISHPVTYPGDPPHKHRKARRSCSVIPFADVEHQTEALFQVKRIAIGNEGVVDRVTPIQREIAGRHQRQDAEMHCPVADLGYLCPLQASAWSALKITNQSFCSKA